MSHVDTSSLGGGSGRGRRGSQDFELNITSIIDCFVVLISFLLISSSYIAIGLLDAGIQAGQVTPTADTPPPAVQVTVELGQNHALRVKLSGKSNERFEIPAQEGQWALGALQAKLKEIRTRWTGVEGVVLTAGPDIEYRDVVVGMEAIRKEMPSILLGEF